MGEEKDFLFLKEKITKSNKKHVDSKYLKNKKIQAVGIEPTTFCVLSRCDSHYTTPASMIDVSLSKVLYLKKTKKNQN